MPGADPAPVAAAVPAGGPSRAVLFDIDGTLIRSRGGHVPFNEAVRAAFDAEVDIRQIRPDGKTDPDILVELFALHGVDPGPVMPRALARFEAELARRLRDAISRGEVEVFALPGVSRLVAALHERSDVALGLVTGNLRGPARVKLAAAGLDAFFPEGGYASDSPSRAVLPGVALDRLSRREGGAELTSARSVVIGDTPLDLAAARRHRMRCVLVATGRHARAELEAASPDVVLDDLSDLDAVCAALGLEP